MPGPLSRSGMPLSLLPDMPEGERMHLPLDENGGLKRPPVFVPTGRAA